MKNNKNFEEKKLWDNVTKLLDDNRVKLSLNWTNNFINDPKELGIILSRYKFSAKMACKNARILELGCEEGIGALILAETSISYTGIDVDKESIDVAKDIYSSLKLNFICEDFLGKKIGNFDAIIGLNIIEYIPQENENIFFKTILKNLSENGICIIGTPNIISYDNALEANKLNYVNLFSQQRLINLMKKYFYQVLPFGMNDEIVHTGCAEIVDYLINIGCHKKSL